MKRLILPFIVMLFSFNAHATDAGKLEKVKEGVALAEQFAGMFQGPHAAEQAIALQQLQQETQLQHQRALQEIKNANLPLVVGLIGGMTLFALLVVTIVGLVLGSDRGRGALSPGYRRSKINRDITDVYETQFEAENFELDQNKSILLGLTHLGNCIMGSVILLGLLSLAGTIITVFDSLHFLIRFCAGCTGCGRFSQCFLLRPRLSGHPRRDIPAGRRNLRSGLV